MTGPGKSRRKKNSNPGSSALEADAVTIKPTMRFYLRGRAAQAIGKCYQSEMQVGDHTCSLAQSLYTHRQMLQITLALWHSHCIHTDRCCRSHLLSGPVIVYTPTDVADHTCSLAQSLYTHRQMLQIKLALSPSHCIHSDRCCRSNLLSHPVTAY